MSYSQIHQISKGKLQSAPPKHTNCSADLAFVPDNEFVELVWENGQILMQGQSSKARKNPSSAAFPHISKSQDKGAGDAVTPKFDKFTAPDSVLNEFSASGHLGLGQEDDWAFGRWLNDHLEDDCSEFFSELSGDNLNGLPAQVNGVPVKGSGYCQMLRDSHIVTSNGSANQEQRNTVRPTEEVLDTTKPRSSQLRSVPLQQLQTSLPSPRSKISDFSSANTNGAHHATCWNSSQNLQFTSGPSNAKMEKQQDIGPARPPPHPSNNSGFLNFSHFLRPTLKNNLQSVRPAPCPPSSSLDRFRNNENISVTGSSNGVESTVIESSTGGSRSITGYQNQPIHSAGKLDVAPPTVDKSAKEHVMIRHSETICKGDGFVKTRSSDQAIRQTSSFAASTAIGRPDNEKAAETVVASSSVCSGNSGGGASNDPKHLSKRKSQNMEESEYPSEDVEEESVAAKKPISGRVGSSTKRSRAAEVHNLSERRRRDRINEKMRALQELIPNCNKVDKASMLDEAIEYLKTLQLQVQIMSMGTGLCMPPMMLPPGMQRMHAPHMAPFSAMGVGMGMGMSMGVGFGMGMLDVGAGSSGCPLIQVPPIHGPQFPCATMSGHASLPMMTGPSPQMFGMPGQGLPIPRPPLVHVPGAPSTKPVPSPVASGPMNVEEVQDSALHSSSKNERENLSLQTPKTSPQFSQDQIATQGTKEGLEQSAMVQKLEQTPHDSCN